MNEKVYEWDREGEREKQSMLEKKKIKLLKRANNDLSKSSAK